MSDLGQTLANCDVRVASDHPSISDMMLRRRELTVRTISDLGRQSRRLSTVAQRC